MKLEHHHQFDTHYEIVISHTEADLKQTPLPINEDGHVVLHWMTLARGEGESAKDFNKRVKDHETMMVREAALLVEHHLRIIEPKVLAEGTDLSKLLAG